MKCIIAGSRTITDSALVAKVIDDSGWADEITQVFCGSWQGVDRCGAWWAERRHIFVRDFPAQWSIYGKGAGPIRNGQMAEYADALILVWDGKSRGSADMLRKAKARGLRIYEYIVPADANTERSEL